MKLSHILLLSAFLLPFQAHAMDPYEIVEKTYDHNVTYSSGFFHHYKEGATLSTQPRPPQKAWTQSSLVYPKDSKTFTQEAVLKKVNPGIDGRERVQNTTAWPYSIHAHLNMVINGADYGGSGVMVGPHHLLTCGHCVYNFNKKNFFEEISVYPALNGKVAPFDKVKVTKSYVFKSWIDQGDQQFDMALLLLDQPIGDYVGWGGLLSAADTDLSQETVNITGYPGDKGFKKMWSMNHKIKTIKPEQFDYEIDTYGGQSGSAVWLKKYGTPMILGVHTLGSDFINSGVRLSGRKFTDLLLRVISDTYTLNKVSPSTEPVPEPRIKPTVTTSITGSTQLTTTQPIVSKSTIPLIALGYEEIYQKFLGGKLIYRPNSKSVVGQIELPISALQNPLEGTFDLSRCGDAGKYLSISTGYRKGKRTENANKVEIWFAPRFLIEKELQTTARHFQEIMGSWNHNAAVGIFWTWGGGDNLSYFDYLVNQPMNELGYGDLYNTHAHLIHSRHYLSRAPTQHFPHQLHLKFSLTARYFMFELK